MGEARLVRPRLAERYGAGVSIVEDLLQHPGIYIGIDRDADGRGDAAARIVVTPLPGGAGVSLDYETFNPAHPDRIRGHVEHAMLARTHSGPAILVTGHGHAESVAVLRETEPGVFELGDEGSPFPVKIVVSMPEPGRLLHSWWYGAPGEIAQERDMAELKLTTA
jgi:hypothetical protein